MMLRFIKDYTLPLAMMLGAIGYLIFTHVPLLAPIKPLVSEYVPSLLPWLIFTQLLLVFCKVERTEELKPRAWHGWLLLFQTLSSLLIVSVLLCIPLTATYHEVFEGALVCLICPTATAAAVITGKLGGSASTLTTYTLLSNLLTAVAVPLLFPLIEPATDITFVTAFLKLLANVFPLLLLPLLLTWILRHFLPHVRQWLLRLPDLAFYLWAVALVIVTGQTLHLLFNDCIDMSIKLMLAAAGLITCGLQFYLGKQWGGYYNDRISAGQALGQKNTVLAIWMSYTYLSPLASIAPASYVIWQNLFNGWQLWRISKTKS
jgi:BASS family bile acid:Na+ symporter